ncbi:MAG: hypothetical protein K6G60_06070 [Lachnospiraceae bacterium]|nr:hypothetical protein [Lachnospiraceae bacterium]
MKNAIKFTVGVLLLGLAFVIGTMVGGDSLGIGSGIGLINDDGEVTEDSVKQSIKNGKEAIEEGKEKAKEYISELAENTPVPTNEPAPTNAPTPTPHPYAITATIPVGVGTKTITFYGEAVADEKELESKIIEAYSVNPEVVFDVNFTNASDKMYETVKAVFEKQKTANGIHVTYNE